MRQLVLTVAGAVGLTLALVIVPGLELPAARAQAVYTGTPSVMDGPMTVNGFVTMTSGLWVDGGVSTTTLRADNATVGSLDAGAVAADSLTVAGKTTTGSLEVMGASTFRERPTGVVLSGSLIKASATGLSIGCNVFGTVSVPGALVGDACVPSAIPTSALTLGITYDCYVTAPATVTLRSCGLVALVSAPAGTYQVRVIGP